MNLAGTPRFFLQRILPLLTIPVVCGAADDREDSVKFFKDQVYPILKEHCYRCHGEEEKLKGDFRITSREGLLHGGGLGPALDEADPKASLLLESVAYTNDDLQMPPKSRLSEDQVAVLTRWITDHQAAYDPALEIAGDPAAKRGPSPITDEQRNWWAYRPIQPLTPPKVIDPAWEENGIDAFIAKGLEDAGLRPNPPAEPGALCRRVYYDLIGLPPTLDEVKTFEVAWAKDSETAWSTLIEALLARPQYGEKWARHWLDLVRYAESNGFERDNPKPWIWRYRDYVINAFNSDKPYDQFVIEQLAGDELAEPTRDSITATGFHRLMQWDDEPADRQQHVYDVLADNVAMTCETFLGMTMGCARCHDHKADPISQKDYYSFMAFFHGVKHYETPGTLVSWATPEQRKSFDESRERKLTDLKAKSDAIESSLSAYLASSEAPAEGAVPASPVTFVEDARSGGVEWEFTTTEPATDWKDVGFRDKSWNKAKGGFGTRGTPGAIVQTEWKTSDIWMRTSFGLEAIPRSLALEIHHDEDVEVFLNGQLAFEAKGFTTGYETVKLPESAIEFLQTGRNIMAVHCRQTGGGQYIDLALRTAPIGDRLELSALLQGKGSAARNRELKDHFGRDVIKEWKDLQQQIDAARKEQPGDLINSVTESGPTPPPLAVHLRGSAHALGDPVVPAFPAVLSGVNEPVPATFTPVEHEGRVSSGRRIALAQWIASPDNPLTARVIMNRLWQHHFGRGICPSTNDLGGLGETPTHPELLEWLASELIREGWSLKAMHRLILNSRAYRMSSAPNEANFAKDPENKAFWRYNMRRLTAEEIRDSILAISGNLNRETFGPWVFPPLPQEVLATASRPGQAWPVSKDSSEHFRRSIYIHVKRSLRHPMMADFDQADTDSPCAVRFSTTVPTQALAMLNSEFINRQAGVLADRLSQFSRDPQEQVKEGLTLALQRDPSADEIRQCLNFMQGIQSQSRLDDRAALERFALMTLNLNEFVFLD